MKPFRLITIPMSHYCEKARWGLERLGLPYHEERHIQGFHYPRTWWVSKGPLVPVLQHSGKVISDSTAILKYLDRFASPNQVLYPDDPVLCRKVEALEDLFDEELGVESRRLVYHHYLDYPERMIAIAAQGTPLIERMLVRPMFPMMRRFASQLLKPTTQNIEKGLQRCRDICKQTDDLLAGKEQYLLGNRFTAADLALACMLAPLVMPDNYGIRLPELIELPTQMRREVLTFRQTRTGQYVLGLFESERLQVTAPTQIALTPVTAN